jgi:SAM-dependent methyltransferase
MESEATYSTSHASPGYGKRYNRNYEAGYYAGLFREVELPILRKLWSSLGKTRRSMLDFACGTGRITSAASPYFDRVVGVDISPEMLKCAAPAKGVEYKHQDIFKDPLPEKFGIVTAFRFFLNAEQGLRVKALEAIRRQLADDGRLICNIHMNANSPMGLVYRALGRTPIPTHNTLSLAQFRQTLKDAGFSVEQVIWYGALPRPGRFMGPLMDRIVGPADRAIGRLGLRGRFAHSFIIVARVDDGASGERSG